MTQTIKFTSAIAEHLHEDFYNVEFFFNGKRSYKGSFSKIELDRLVKNHKDKVEVNN